MSKSVLKFEVFTFYENEELIHLKYLKCVFYLILRNKTYLYYGITKNNDFALLHYLQINGYQGNKRSNNHSVPCYVINKGFSILFSEKDHFKSEHILRRYVILVILQQQNSIYFKIYLDNLKYFISKSAFQRIYQNISFSLFFFFIS